MSDNVSVYQITDESLSTEVDMLLNNPAYTGIPVSLLRREVELEAKMRISGLERELNNNEKAKRGNRESETSYGIALLRDNVYKVSKVIDTTILILVRKGEAGSRRNAFRHVKDMSSKTLAYLTLKTVIDSISTIVPTLSLQKMGHYIGNALENEARCIAFQTYAEKQYKLAMDKQKNRSRKRRESKAYDAFFGMMSKAAIGFYGNEPNELLQWKHWPESDKVIMGVKLLYVVAEETGLIKITKHKDVYEKTNSLLYYVSINNDIHDWIKTWAYNTGLMTPVCLPTVIPPKPYTNPLDGGYHTSLIRRFPLVKSKDPAYNKYLFKKSVVEQMSPVYNAVNTAMSTPYRINTKVLDVMQDLWNKAIPVDCLPPQEDLPRPLCPKCGRVVGPEHECFVQDKAIYAVWTKAAKEIHALNTANESKRLAIMRILHVANTYRDDAEIYFPYQLDFRGRIYALPNFLNPQGSDTAKGLLTFAHGKPLETQEAADWLAIHVANTHGEDKLSFADRIAWTKKKSELIQNIANSPLDYLSEWTNADSPFCFLAACFEWAGYCREGLSYVSSLPVALDGTCSGLQHYSAMLRDEVGGNAVNLTPADKPSDIYGIVADRTADRLKAMTPENSDPEDYTLAQEWLNSDILNRKITKRSVMTLPYGSTLYSAKDYVVDRMKEARDKEHRSLPWEKLTTRENLEEFNRQVDAGKINSDPFTYAGHWLACHIWESIHETVIAATEAMSWLKKMARVVVKQGKPVTWVTPSGLPVMQRYVEEKERRIDTSLSGSAVYRTGGEKREVDSGLPNRLQLTIKEPTDKLDLNKQASGVAPNFVHSMDASALVFAVNTARDKYGVHSFALIHDSFGTHAADTSNLAKAIRESFVRMYEEHDVIQEFFTHVSNVVSPGTELPTPPARGKLDLKQVYDSPYFFS